MFRSLILDARSELMENVPDEHQQHAAPETKAPRASKHDRSAAKVGHLLSTPIENYSRKKMMKTVPHLNHHFEKGYGAGEGDERVVDADDLATLSRHAQHISDQANALRRMPGPAHHLAGHLSKHVANCHDRMHAASKSQGQDEMADLHANESAKFRALQKHHRMAARRHGIYDESY